MENTNQEAKVVEAASEDVVTTPSAEQTATPPAEQTPPAKEKPKKDRGRPPKEKKPPKPKKPKASDMTLEDLAETELVHAKITVSEDQKEEYAPLLGFIGQRFSSRRELQEAGLEVAIMYYMETEKGKGIIQHVEGQITMFDSTTQVIGINGNKYKLNCTYTIEALNFDPFDEDTVYEPQNQDEDDEDEDTANDENYEDAADVEKGANHRGDEYRDDRYERCDRSSSYSSDMKFYYIENENGFTLRVTAAQYKEMERMQEAMRKQMERDMEKMREQQCRDFARKYGGTIDDDGYYADQDSGYWPDERPPKQKSEDNSSSDSGSSSKKSRGPKTIGWLPPEKRKLEIHDKRKKGTKKKADGEGSSSEDNSSSEE